MSYTDFDFPHSDFYDSDLRELIKKVETLWNRVNTFINLNQISFADPIQWDITKQYAKSVIVINEDGDAFLSKQPVPAGVELNNESYWLEIFNFMDYIKTFDSNLTFNIERNTDRATHQYFENDWLLWNDVLYKVLSTIDIDDLLVIGTNIERFTVEDFCRAWQQYMVTTIQQYKNDIDASELAYKNEIDASELAYRQQLAQDIANTTASLQAQLDVAIAGATVDSEVINARVGDDGITYNTLGNAIRGQFSDIKKLVPHGWKEIDASTLGFANGRLESDKTINTTYDTRQYVFLDPAYNYFVWCEPDAKITYSCYHSDVLLPNPNLLTSGAAKVPGYIRDGDG